VSSDWAPQPDSSGPQDRWDLPIEVELICQRVNELDDVERARVLRALSAGPPDKSQGNVLTSPSRIVCFLAFCCLGLIPWTIGLGLTLPRSYLVDNWPLAWIGFDTILLGCLGTTAWALWKQRQVAVMASMISSVLFFCDAWFDVVTAHNGRCLVLSISTAVLGEIPIAILLGLVSVRLLQADQDVVARSSGSSPTSLWQVPLRWPLHRTVEADRTSTLAGTSGSKATPTRRLEYEPTAAQMGADGALGVSEQQFTESAERPRGRGRVFK